MTMIFMPVPQQPPRREIVKDGITYREVRPGDDATGWDVLKVALVVIFALFPAVMAVVIWILGPMMNWMMRHGPGL